jgi:hypothetical protein
MEVVLDRVTLGSPPRLLISLHQQEQRREVVTVPEREIPKLYVGRFVSVRDAEGVERRGCVEPIDELSAVVRYLDWNDDSGDS